MKFNTSVCAAALLSIFIAAEANASGFQIREQSGSKLGNSFAGAGSEASDPSVMFYNPAGMTRLSGNQATVAGHLIIPEIEFDNQGSQNVTGNNGGNAVGVFFLPNAYVFYDVAEDYKFGFSINSPFGLETDYKDGFIGRYQGSESALQTISFGPNFAFKVSDDWSLGAGVYMQHLFIRLNQDLRFSALGPFEDGQGVLEGDSTRPHFTIGAMYEPTDTTRFGMTYRSETQHRVTGTARFTNPTPAPTAGAFVQTPLEAEAILPESLLFSAYHELDDRWAIMTDIEWTRWSRLQNIVVDFANPLQTDQHLRFDWESSIFYSVGANYKLNDEWLLRTGVAYDESPQNSNDRTPRVPDSNRTWLSIGATYSGLEDFVLDAGYTHIFVDDANVRRQNDTSTDLLIGQYQSNIDILSVQATYNF